MDATEHFNTVELLLLVLKDSRLNVKTVAQGANRRPLYMEPQF